MQSFTRYGSSGIFTILLFAFTSCTASNHTFAERAGGLPDIQALEEADQRRVSESGADDESEGLANLFWCPLVIMQGEGYGPTEEQMPKGMTYIDMDAYGPLFMIVDHVAYHYDEDKQLYERASDSQFLWGLWASERNDVRVPSGWRSATKTSLLFGLLKSRSRDYAEDAPADLQEPASL
jgi:hypothetical protein